MAQITTVGKASAINFVGAFGYVVGSFQATDLAATVTNGDRIKLCTIPANCKVIGASLRLTGTSAVTAIAHMQVVGPTGDAIALTPTSGAPAAPSIALATVMTLPHSPITSVTGTRDLEIVCATGTLSATNGLVWYWEADLARFP